MIRNLILVKCMHLRHSRSSLQRIHYRDLWQMSLSPAKNQSKKELEKKE